MPYVCIIRMNTSHIILKEFEGQSVMINTESKVLILELRQVFNYARQKLGWDMKYGDKAFGINRTIINFIIGSEYKLLIRFVQDETAEYWINYDELRDFKMKVNCLFYVSKSKQVYNIPLSLFKSKNNFSGVSK